jgi:hypothetical protein
MNRDKLAGIAVGLEREGGVGYRFGEVDLSEDIPGLAGIARSVPRDAFFQRCHDIGPRSGSMTLPPAFPLSSIPDVAHAAREVDFLQKFEV